MITIRHAIHLIKKGEIVAYPTETAYGLGTDALNEKAVNNLFKLKNRTKEKKLVVLVDSLKRIEGLNTLGKYLSENFHPGPLNIVIKHSLPWIGAFRISSNNVANTLARKTRTLLTSTSANLSGKKTPFSPNEIPFDVPIVEGVALKKTLTSTVYDPFEKRIIRKGAISENKINQYVFAFETLKKIKPSEKQEKEIDKIKKEIMRKVKKRHFHSLMGGSIAKKTYLKKVEDFDVFLIFSKKADLNEKINLLELIAKDLGGKFEKNYAQHPYIKTTYKGYKVELVPAHNTRPSKIISATDRSRWHVKFVNKFSEQMKDEVRILKQFCKGIEVYGAETKVEGLSSYAMEVLIYGNKSFVKTLEKISEMKWPLFLSDPVDRKRNVLASVSQIQFERVKTASKAYLKNPNMTFFFPHSIQILEKPKVKNIVILEFKKPKKLVEEAVWGWSKGKARKIKKNAALFGYNLKKFKVSVEKKSYLFLMFDQLTNKKIEVRGPPKKHKNAKKFKKLHNNCFVKKGRLYAVENNKFSNVKKLILNLENCKIFSGKDAKEKYKKLSRKGKIQFSSLIFDKEPWERE